MPCGWWRVYSLVLWTTLYVRILTKVTKHSKNKLQAKKQTFCTKFFTEMENRQHNGSQCSEVGFSKIHDGGRPPSWISILGHNFGVDQHLCTKFCIKMENGQPGFQFSEIRFSKIQDGRRPPSCISIFGYNFGVDQYFCTKFGTVMENRQPKGSQCSEVGFLKI